MKSSLNLAAAAARRLLGIELVPVSHAERVISAIGEIVAIYVLILVERTLLGEAGAALIVASMGASAVLLFAVPHGALSQPWAVLVGHTVSAVVGVTCAKFLPDVTLASAVAVGLSIGAMHYLRAIHPPGGATALTAVIGGSQVHALGYKFVLTPVLLNALLLVAAAVVINVAFEWRRYPAALGKSRKAMAADDLTHSDFVSALSRIGTFVDVSEEEFLRLQELTKEAAQTRRVKPQDVRIGACYANGGLGLDFTIRMIVDQSRTGDDVIWRVVVGRNRHQTGLCSRSEFAAWAGYEVMRSESTWSRAA